MNSRRIIRFAFFVIMPISTYIIKTDMTQNSQPRSHASALLPFFVREMAVVVYDDDDMLMGAERAPSVGGSVDAPEIAIVRRFLDRYSLTVAQLHALIGGKGILISRPSLHSYLQGFTRPSDLFQLIVDVVEAAAPAYERTYGQYIERGVREQIDGWAASLGLRADGKSADGRLGDVIGISRPVLSRWYTTDNWPTDLERVRECDYKVKSKIAKIVISPPEFLN
jgi:hypothetical protein